MNRNADPMAEAESKRDAHFVIWMKEVNAAARRNGWREKVEASKWWRAQFDAGLTPLQALDKPGIFDRAKEE
jgi:hypothetical protein